MKNPTNQKQQQSAELASQGNHQMFIGRFHDAIHTFDNAIKIDKECLLALQGRAFCKTILLEDSPKDQQTFEEIASDLLKSVSLVRNILEELDFS